MLLCKNQFISWALAESLNKSLNNIPLWTFSLVRSPDHSGPTWSICFLASTCDICSSPFWTYSNTAKQTLDFWLSLDRPAIEAFNSFQENWAWNCSSIPWEIWIKLVNDWENDFIFKLLLFPASLHWKVNLLIFLTVDWFSLLENKLNLGILNPFGNSWSRPIEATLSKDRHFSPSKAGSIHFLDHIDDLGPIKGPFYCFL